MSIKLQLPELTDLTPRLTVIGVGGAGCNGVNNMIAAGLTGVEFVAANTDAQALAASSAEHRIQLGANLTEGLGAGAKPEIGQAAAEEALDDIKNQIAGSHMVFIAAGMGGGTGTGAAKVIARAAREQQILTVAVVTLPFQFEGSRRMRIAQAGVEELRNNVDTMIVIPNQNLFRIANEKTTFAEAFVLADQVLYSGVACIVDLIIKDGLINLDFADVRAVMSGMGSAMMGTGESVGERRAILAAEEAIANPLLDDVSLHGANGVLLSITGGPAMTLYEVDEAASRVRQEVDPDANIIVGATFDEALDDRIRVSIVASGMQDQSQQAGQPTVAPSGAPNPIGTHHTGETATAVPAPPRIMTPGEAYNVGAPPPPQSQQDIGDLQKRLTDAMQRVDSQNAAAVHANEPNAPTVVATGAPPQAGQQINADAQMPTWQGPGDVTIKPKSANDPSRQSQTPPPIHQSASVQAHQASGRGMASSGDAATFHPRPPTDVPRTGVRMPDIDEFPAVGQRAYHARVQNEAMQQSDNVGESAEAKKGAGERRGLFQRLAGIGRRENESPVDKSGSRIERKAEESGQVAPQHPHGGEENAAVSGDDDQRELPKFFNQQRR